MKNNKRTNKRINKRTTEEKISRIANIFDCFLNKNNKIYKIHGCQTKSVYVSVYDTEADKEQCFATHKIRISDHGNNHSFNITDSLFDTTGSKRIFEVLRKVIK